jgi:oligopeptide/dipeptide ABC transporter ATP-binding protein
MSKDVVLQVEDLKVHFPVKKGLFKRVVGQVKAVDGISFRIHQGETLGLVGESGCGKTTIGRAIVKLSPITDGRVVCNDLDITFYGNRQMRPLRSAMQMIFQDPFSSLNPRMTVGDIIAEPIRFHRPGADYQQEVLRYMELTGLRSEYLKRYPHQFSGGQRQRIGIARALACEPKLVIADEPVSALDVSIQAQIINLLKGLQRRLGLAFLFISHDLAVVKHISQQVAVMYLGAIMETSPADELYRRPLHPYTQALMASAPVNDPRHRGEMKGLEGEIPSPMDVPPGCKFQTRCPHVQEICRSQAPSPEDAGEDHLVACHFWRDI